MRKSVDRMRVGDEGAVWPGARVTPGQTHAARNPKCESRAVPDAVASVKLWLGHTLHSTCCTAQVQHRFVLVRSLRVECVCIRSDDSRAVETRVCDVVVSCSVCECDSDT